MNFFKQFAIAVYQFDKYKELISLSGGKAFLYEIILFIITAVISFFPFMYVFIEYGGTRGLIEEFVPEFKIEKGTLYSETTVFNEGNSIIIIDGNNLRSEFDFQGVENGVIFDKEKVIVDNGVEKIQKSYDELLSLAGIEKFEKNDIFNYLTELNIFIFIFIAVTAAGLAVSEAMGIVFLSFCALIINRILKGKLRYGELFKISIYVRTPAVILTILFALFGMSAEFILVIILDLAYMFFAVKKCIK